MPIESTRPVPPIVVDTQPLDDTFERRGICLPQPIWLDTGRGPDQTHIVIYPDGSSTVTVNGREFDYSAEETRNLSVMVNEGDPVTIEDRRSAAEQARDPWANAPDGSGHVATKKE